MIAIIDYDAGNLASVAHAVTNIGFDCTITNDLKIIEKAERVIFPGVGAAGAAMDSLNRLGLDSAIKKTVASGKPLLGICLGTQIIMSFSEENNTKCLDIIEGNVKAFPKDILSSDNRPLKIPHMGWNSFKRIVDHPVIEAVNRDDEFYFVHSYYPDPVDEKHVIGTSHHGIIFPSIIGFNNVIATQFHPEKSGRPGLNLLKNFCEWQPC